MSGYDRVIPDCHAQSMMPKPIPSSTAEMTVAMWITALHMTAIADNFGIDRISIALTFQARCPKKKWQSKRYGDSKIPTNFNVKEELLARFKAVSEMGSITDEMLRRIDPKFDGKLRRLLSRVTPRLKGVPGQCA